MNQAEMINPVFLQLRPVALFQIPSPRAPIFLRHDVPFIQADAGYQVAVGKSNDQLFPERLPSKLIVAME